MVFRNWFEIGPRQDGGDSIYRKEYSKVMYINMGNYLLMIKQEVRYLRV